MAQQAFPSMLLIVIIGGAFFLLLVVVIAIIAAFASKSKSGAGIAIGIAILLLLGAPFALGVLGFFLVGFRSTSVTMPPPTLAPVAPVEVRVPSEVEATANAVDESESISEEGNAAGGGQ